MFELIDPYRHLRALGRVVGFLLVFSLGWVIFGALLKVCALLFLVGWGLI